MSELRGRTDDGKLLIDAEEFDQLQARVKELEADDYKTWYEEAITSANEAGFAGMSAAQVIDYQDGEIMQLRASNARLAEALEEARQHVVVSPDPVRGDFIQEIEAALAAYRKKGG